jgi:uncharacterized membrane protein YdbT with pleckstrin-like domain
MARDATIALNQSTQPGNKDAREVTTDDAQGLPLEDIPPFSSANDAPANVMLKLRAMPLFAQLPDHEFKAVTRLLRGERVLRGALLLEQGGHNTNLYILRRGRAAVRMVDLEDVEHLAGFLSVGTIFNETAFLTSERNRQTVEALEDLSLWYIPRDAFRQLLADNPDIEAHLTYPEIPDAPAPALVHTMRRLNWQRDGETVVLFRKKHIWVFLRKLWPVLLCVLIVLLLRLPLISVTADALMTFVLAGMAAFLGPYVLLQFIDWQNDYFAITDQRILHRERVLLIRDEQDELPLNKVQDVKVDRPSFFSLLFDLGNVIIEASGTHSRVRFIDIAHPDDVADVIFQQLARTRVETHASQRAKIRAELRRELGLSASVTAAEAARAKRKPTPPALRAQMQQYGASLRALRNTILPRMRVVQGDAVIYRRHWLQLLETIGAQLALVLIYSALLVLIRLASPELAAVLLETPLVLGVVGVGLFLLGWLVYRYEDWRNDIYMVTSDRVVDIDRTPFGLLGTSRKEAKLAAVQNVTSNTRGFLDVAFNMGDVIIQTAGGEGQLTFERVHDPRRVQRDITDRIDAFDTATREKQAAQRRREMTEWLGIYDELTQLHDRKKLG